MVLRPAEVAIISLICVSYAIQPLATLIGAHVLEESDKKNLVRILAILLLGIRLISQLHFSTH